MTETGGAGGSKRQFGRFRVKGDGWREEVIGRKSRESRGDGDGGWRSGRTLTATEGEAFGSAKTCEQRG